MKSRKFFRSVVSFLMVLIGTFTLVSATSCENKSWRSGVFTTLSLSLVAENGNVSAIVRNDFTLGFATVKAYVYLYSSESYTENLDEMTERAVNSVEDLDIFSELKAVAKIEGERSYWCAKLVYRENNKNWSEVCTAIYTVDVHSGISL